MADTFESLKNGLARLSTRQKIQLAAAVLAIVGLLWGVSAYATRVRYGVLFSNVRAEEAGPVLAALKERQVPFRVTAGGSVIEVPLTRVNQLRLELAGDGVLPGSGVGFEIFDKPAFGLSDFVQNVNYRRALERELGRTITSLDSVESARVHLALPPESVFADERRDPSASVVVKLRSGGQVSSQQMRAITHMVASGVEGLDPARVSVIDSHGMLLSGEDEGGHAVSASQVEARQAMERQIESRLVSILEPLVGKNRVRARATVALNMKRVSRVEETFDPNVAVVRSEQKTKSEQLAGGGGGTPGTSANLPDGNPAAAAGTGSREKSQSAVTNFELNKTVATIEEPVGSLLRQSVAVVVDHASVESTGEDGQPASTEQPRTDEDMQKITEIVRAAIGYDEARGDTLIVQNVPFDQTAREVAELPSGTDIWYTLLTIARVASLPLAVLLIVLLVVRPGIRALRSLQPDQGQLGGGPVTVGELQAQLAQGALPAAGETSSFRSKLIEAAREDPKTAALIVRDWMSDKGGK